MKKVLVLLALLYFAMPCFAATKLIHYYPSTSIYYYYSPDFKPESFVKPAEVKRTNFSYSMFIYTKPLSASKFKTFAAQQIQNEPGFLYPMILIGIENKPDYFVFSTFNEYNHEIINMCKLDNKTYNQIKYTNQNESGQIKRQMSFNNGEFSIGSICNPDFVPGDDI